MCVCIHTYKYIRLNPVAKKCCRLGPYNSMACGKKDNKPNIIVQCQTLWTFFHGMYGEKETVYLNCEI